jgi:hypothetical protein
MFDAVIKAVAASAPQALNGKIDELLVDADGICYFCAGSATTTPGQALINVQEKLKAVEAVAGQRATLIATGEASPKGNRYTIATVKPYQGNRGKSPKPKNWAFLRKRMLAGEFGRKLEVEEYAEADDRCASRAGPRTALHYQDKDFRMMPGWHVTWKNYALVYVPEDCWELVHDGMVYGEKWFWLQMLQGDPADHIPGVPKLFGQLCGDTRAAKYLAGKGPQETRDAVLAAYVEFYGDKAWAMMLEQAQLLWMRKNPADDMDVVNNGPLKGWTA